MRARPLALALALAVTSVAGLVAQGTAGRTSRSFTVVSTGRPLFLFAEHESHISLTLHNNGSVVWDPQQKFQVAYHWQRSSRPGREVVVVDGARTALPRPVAPGESISVEASVLPPAQAGVYYLQWDVVEEGVAWFYGHSQFGPEPIRVIVLPNLAASTWPHGLDALSLIPALLALALWWILRRLRAPRGGWLAGGAIWCTVSLLAKQAMLVGETRSVPVTRGFWLDVLLAASPVVALVLLARGRWRPRLLWVLVLCGSVVMFADVIYFRYFGDVLSSSVLIAAGQTTTIVDSITTLTRAHDLWFFVDLAAAVPLLRNPAWRTPPGAAPSWTARLLAAAACPLAAVGAVFLLSTTAGAQRAIEHGYTNVRVIRQLGLFGYHAYDAWSYLEFNWQNPPLSESQLDEVRAWFGEREPLRAGTGPLFGIAKHRNLLVVQVESLQGFVVGLQMNGQEVTPNLNRWARKGFAFSAATDQTNEGRSSDAELTTMVSLLPLDHGAAAYQYPGNHFVGLPSVLRANGYTTISAVPFGPYFWNRRATHEAYGFSQNLFQGAFEPGEKIGWGLNDRDFLRQMAPKLAALPKPFLAWLITLSLHHPYWTFPDRHKVMELGEWEGKPLGNYLHAMRFVDTALGELRDALANEGLADDTVIVVYGDHDAGFNWRPPLTRALGYSAQRLDLDLQDRVPWLILLPGVDAPHAQMNMPAGQLDMAPTLLALLGIDPAPLPFMGRNLLAHQEPDLHVRQHGGWIDGRLLFDGDADSCYDIAAREPVPVEVCREGNAKAARAREISRLVFVHDLQAKLVE